MSIEGIPLNKNLTQSIVNYNSGRLFVKCFINRHCPITLSSKESIGLVFNNNTLKSFPKEYNNIFNTVSAGGSVSQDIGTITELPGMYLREQRNCKSNFLALTDEKGGLKYGWEDQTTPAQSGYGLKYPYKKIQTWIVERSVFDREDSVIQTPEQYGQVYLPAYNTEWKTTGICSAAWGMTLYGNPTIFSEDEIIEPTNGVNVPIQMKSYIGCSENPWKAEEDMIKSGQDVYTDVPVHWRLRKATNLFRGEDFFIILEKRSIDTNTINIPSVKFRTTDKIYKTLDVNDTDTQSSSDIPSNFGVLQYKMEDENGNIKYTPIEESKKYFDFCTQAYYIVEIGYKDPQHNYFIVIPQNYYPTCIKVVKVTNKQYSTSSDQSEIDSSTSENPGAVEELGGGSSSGGLSSFVMHVFKGVSGAKLFQDNQISMQVRTHLGRLVITFSGYEDKPWIIEQTIINADDEKIIEIPNAPITVWGGNIQASVMFAPLQYEASATLNLPVSTVKSPYGNLEIEGQTSFELPKIGAAKNEALLSISDTELDSAYQMGSKNKEMFDCDAQQITEASSTGQGSSKQPFFLNTGKLLKEVSEDYLSSINLKMIANSKYDNKRVFAFGLNVKMISGSYLFEDADEDGNPYIFANVITPILTNIRLVSTPSNEDAWSTQNIDVSDLVLSFTDSWKEQNFHIIEHTGSITFLINRGMTESNSLAGTLEGMRERAFYIEVYAGYLNKNLIDGGCNYTQLPSSCKIFTGICLGGEISIEAGKRTMTCPIFDYTKILQDIRIFNSPFFDGMRDLNAVNEITQMAGFKSQSMGDPGYLIKKAADKTGNELVTIGTPDGRMYQSYPWALPAGYDRVQSPFFKFGDGDTFWEMLTKLAQKAGKVIFFDTNGMFHYETLPFDAYVFGNAPASSVKGQWYFTTDPHDYGQTVFNTVVYSATVSDVYNDIYLMTCTPYQTLIFAHDTNYKSIEDVNARGFLGYKKTFFQADGIFGTDAALKRLLIHYGKFYTPPVAVKFETYGQPIRALDIAIFNKQQLIITSVNSTLDPNKNLWWQTIEGEWYETPPMISNDGGNQETIDQQENTNDAIVQESEVVLGQDNTVPVDNG